MTNVGLRAHQSALLRSPNLIAVLDPSRLSLAWSQASGLQEFVTGRVTQVISPEEPAVAMQQQRGWAIQGWLSIPVAETAGEVSFPPGALEAAADDHVARVIQSLRLQQIDLGHFTYLASHVERFLDDHPTYDRSVFLMMRFDETLHHQQIYATIRDTMASRGYDVIRADQKDYHDELWSNVVVQMLGCRYGVAVFEQIDEREFNPNIALEVGFMLARGQRVLLLKEQRVEALNTDIVGRLYKPFDMMNIESTVRAQVTRWANVDLA